MKRFEGKIVFVTGGTRGIGLGLAKRFGEEGATVIICSRKKDNLDQALQELSGLKIDGHVCDVGNKSKRLELIKYIETAYGRLDVLVPNVAASTHFGLSLDIDDKAFDKMIELNIKQNFFLVKETIHLLRKGVNPNILFMSSVAGKNPNFMLGIYSMTKAAMNSMTEFLSQELRSDGIRVNALGPGVIKTNFAKSLWENP